MKFGFGVGSVVSALAMVLAVPVQANDAALLFGMREDIRQISISPDGANIAYISSRNPIGEVLYVVPVAGGEPKPILTSGGGTEELYRCNWISDSRMICNVAISVDMSGLLATFDRMLAVDRDGQNMKVLFKEQSAFRERGFTQEGGSLIDFNSGKPGEVLVTRDFVPESSLNTRLAETRKGLGVDRLDAATLARRTIEQPHLSAVEYITDGKGTVRIMGLQPGSTDKYRNGLIEYLYRKPGSSEWQALSKLQFDGVSQQGFNPVAVDPALNAVYGFDDKDGFRALYRIGLDGSLARELVKARDGVDIDGLVRIGRDRRVVGVSYAEDYRHAELFDPDLVKLMAALRKALPGSPALDVIDADAGENKFLLMATSDVNPGMVYLFDKTTRALSEVMPVRQALADVKLAPMKPVSFPAADGTIIPGYLTLPPGSDGRNLPAIVMPHGGPSARDEWGFDWLVQYFAHQGYAVLQPNFRGSAGFGESWLMRNGFQSWRTAIGDVNDAGRWLLSQGIAAKDKLAIVGWSYGGYAALQSGVTEPALYKAIVAIAPVTDLGQLREDHRDYTDFALVNRQIGTGPSVAEGSPAQNAEKIVAPVLMFHGDRDENVRIGQSRLMNKRLSDAGKTVRLVEFPDLEHSLESTLARTQMLGESDAFIRKALGLPVAAVAAQQTSSRVPG